MIQNESKGDFMKFCTKCGTQMEDDVNFCPKCGTATNSANQVVNVESKSEVSEKDSSSIVAKLKELHSYFSEIGNAYNIFDNGIGLINDAEWRKTVNKKYKMSVAAKVSWLLLLIFILAIVICYNAARHTYSITPLLLNLLFWFLAIVAFSCGIVFSIQGKGFKNHKKALDFYDKNVPIAQKQIQEHYAKLENCPLGIDYTSPSTIERLAYYLNSHRADSLKEAINVLEDERHKANVENTLAATRKAAEAAAFASQMTAINTSL